MIEIAREFVTTGSGYFSPQKEDMMADDFVFRGPIVGPLCRADYKTVLGNNKIYEAWPDINPNCFGFTVDPMEPNRVWWMTRVTGTQTGPLKLGPRITLPATNKKAVLPPEMHSALIDEETGKIKLLTFGYVCDLDSPGATAPLIGGLFALLASAGFPVPAYGPVAKLLQAGGEATLGIKSVSKDEDIPAWYKEYVGGDVRKGMEGTP
mmetsp:Transcript_19563/g.62267  ORF Transcript_19563/g.62267 Transcript_19563/m.62267 type:complete len:208 (+) Transcript_19563:238-861(+)